MNFAAMSSGLSLVSRAAWQILAIVSIYCRPPGFIVVSMGKCLAGGLQSGCTVKLTGAQYILHNAEYCLMQSCD